MIIGAMHDPRSQDAIDELRRAAAWARDEAQDRVIDTSDWMRAMTAAQSFEAQADELQADLDRLLLS